MMMLNPTTTLNSAHVQITPRLPILALAISLGLFFAVTFTLCVLFDLAIPLMAMHAAWMPLLPGFTWLSLSSFLLGLVESFIYGIYVALIFGPLFNLCTRMIQGNRQ